MNHFDVIIVGAGISGIGAACHLGERSPSKTYAILEGREAIGGTWDLFRYPGIRSDSDMHTLGYEFKPWLQAKAIADGPSIRSYLNETADEHDVRRHIRFGHLVTSAAWSTEHAHWRLTVRYGESNDEVEFTSNFLFMCGGYYSYEGGFTPEFEGMDRFTGTIVHPQKWPEDLDYFGKRVVVIGSGATAMTLVPAMAQTGAHVTMVQRSPTYVVSRPDTDAIANALRRFLPERVAYAITRFKNTQMQRWFYHQTRTKPARVKQKLLGMVDKALGADYVKEHFTPTYNPWDQRLCLIPNEDLYQVIRDGSAEVVTDQIEGFTETGLALASGRTLEADIIVTATGLNLVVLSGVTVSVDGRPVDLAETFSYKGMMFSDVPNLVQSFGYVNASWTLRADLTCEYVCRLVNRMDELGVRQCTPRMRDEDRNMVARPWIDDFSAGYMRRVMDRFPKQGDRAPWLNTQNYAADRKMIRKAALEDGTLVFDNPARDPAIVDAGLKEASAG
jgi:cation diffusion facilitator CzcD-associated flavoprotein CzcO